MSLLPIMLDVFADLVLTDAEQERADMTRVLRAHGFLNLDAAFTGPWGECDDCGDDDTPVLLIPDFDIETGERLTPFACCAECLPLRCGNGPDCEGCSHLTVDDLDAKLAAQADHRARTP